MKRTVFASASLALVAVWLGCGSATDSAAPDSSLDLVTLKVPNMT